MIEREKKNPTAYGVHKDYKKEEWRLAALKGLFRSLKHWKKGFAEKRQRSKDIFSGK